MATNPSLPGFSVDNPGNPGTLLFENDQVRVWELILKPGEYCLWHNHPYDHLLVITEGCRVEGQAHDGELVYLDIEDHQTIFIPAKGHPEVARNVSPDRTLRELIIDLKAPVKGNPVALFSFYRPGTATTATSTPTYASPTKL